MAAPTLEPEIRSTVVRRRRLNPILPIPPVPRFPIEVKGVWKFDESLEDDVGTNDFIPAVGLIGSGSSTSYTQFSRYELLPNGIITRNGLAFEANKPYAATNSYSYGESWTISFWWNTPGLVGFTKHATTRELESKVAPVFAIANTSTSDSQTSLVDATIVLTEIGYSKTKNAIRVYLSEDGTNISQIITSEQYNAPGFHHVLVTYMKNAGRFRIDIDGKTGILHSAPTANLQKTGKLRINAIAPGYLAHKTTQVGGYLFDLVFSTYASTSNESLKAFRYGYEHISEETLFDTRFAYFGMAYSQPTTISTTQIFVDGGNVFAARSNGKIVKGARPVWDKEFNYPNTQSVALLTTSETDDDRTIKWTTGGLKLQGVSIRI